MIQSGAVETSFCTWALCTMDAWLRVCTSQDLNFPPRVLQKAGEYPVIGDGIVKSYFLTILKEQNVLQ